MTIPHWLWVGFASLVCVGPVATILIWGVIWYRVERTIRTVPTLRFGETLAAVEPPTGRVCVVVPAYNESRVIAGLVASLRAETYPQLHLVLALDRCTDDTAALARTAIGGDDRFEIVEIDMCPDDWVGKVHAVHAGLARSRVAADAEYLLFADADTLFSPGCIASALALMRERKVDLLSLLSTLTYDDLVRACRADRRWRWSLCGAIPSPWRTVSTPAAFARSPNGQFMLFRRDAYEAIGGHEAVRDSLFEDVALARRIAAARPQGQRLHGRRSLPLPHVRELDAVPPRLEADLFAGGGQQGEAPVAVVHPGPLARYHLSDVDARRGPAGAFIAARDPVRGWTGAGALRGGALRMAGRAHAHRRDGAGAAMDRAASHRRCLAGRRHSC